MENKTTVFHDVSQFVACPRFTSLLVSPDGERVIATRSELNSKKNAYVSALWEIERDGGAPRRLTRGVEGETLVGFTRESDILFTAKRDTGEDSEDQPLFLLPRSGGEARVIARRHGGFSRMSLARESGRIALVSNVHPGAKDASDDARIAQERREGKVSGILHTGYPVRYWDHDLGPARPQVFVSEPLEAADDESQLNLRQLTHLPPHESLGDVLISPDGRTVFASITRTLRGTHARTEVVRIDVASGQCTTLASDDDAHISLVAVCPTGTRVFVQRSRLVSRHVSLKVELHTLDLDSGELAAAFTSYEGWPNDLQVSEDGRTAYFTADHEGRGAIFSLDIASGDVQRLTEGRHHFTHLGFDARRSELFALADAIDQPPLPVSVDPHSRELTSLDGGIEAPAVPGTLTEFTTTVADGSTIRSWLCLPTSASASTPAPLLLWIHGGPFGSWNAWTWRWNPWIAVARGYAVLLPDPAISTGYGQSMIDRGWSELGGAPYDDLMRATNDALAREDIDDSRKAALGGSYGGFMANWIAGNTGDFFDCIVTHASLWNMDQFRHTTDTAIHWGAHIDDSHVADFNPADHVGNIVAPMLVIHGDKDYRVPIGEGLRLWFELLSASQRSPEDNKHRFLYFPDENHWILQPNNSVMWYETVLAFVDTHVLGRTSEYPQLLGS